MAKRDLNSFLYFISALRYHVDHHGTEIALPSLIHHIFQVSLDSACVDKTFMLQHAKRGTAVFTRKTDTLHGKPDRADYPLSKVYKIYGIMIITVVK